MSISSKDESAKAPSNDVLPAVDRIAAQEPVIKDQSEANKLEFSPSRQQEISQEELKGGRIPALPDNVFIRVIVTVRADIRDLVKKLKSAEFSAHAAMRNISTCRVSCRSRMNFARILSSWQFKRNSGVV